MNRPKRCALDPRWASSPRIAVRSVSGRNSRGFVSSDLRVREVLEEVTAQDTLATLRTDKRILVFGSLRGTWSIQDREIR